MKSPEKMRIMRTVEKNKHLTPLKKPVHMKCIVNHPIAVAGWASRDAMAGLAAFLPKPAASQESIFGCAMLGGAEVLMGRESLLCF